MENARSRHFRYQRYCEYFQTAKHHNGKVGDFLNLGILTHRGGLIRAASTMAALVSARGATRSYATERISMSKFLPTRAEWLRSVGPAIRGSAVGSFFGTLPGTGQTVASFVGYALEKRISPRGDKFGTGQIEGVVVPEAANNAAAQTAIPRRFLSWARPA